MARKGDAKARVVALRGMVSIDALTNGRRGYPNLFQTGEGLTDRQHPHDLFMEMAASYSAPERDDASIRAFRDQVREHIKASGTALVDVRSPQEYSGERTHMPEYPQEGTLRGGHIPTAASIPWAQAVNADSTFKSLEYLQALYGGKGTTPDKAVIAYCRIGERSSHTWFVLTYLLGYPQVRNYDGSWTEWGNGVGLPIEKSYQG